MAPTEYPTNGIANCAVGDRVELHPATDLWMRGARYGEVVHVLPLGRFPHERIRVRADADPRRLYLFHAGNVGKLI